ncbi:MAG: tryptophan synthase subunit beta [Firmicutes bacterium]|jgi:tryptophan synthase, beta subunit|nr:tryptophan synthase subunit beta [Bacillota bacterium]
MNKTRKSNAGVQEGYFGQFGGAFVSETLKKELDRVYAEYLKLKKDESFRAELSLLQRTYQGRPTPLYYCKKLSEQTGGADIYLKREDLNHTGAHKINHCIGEVLLAKHMGKDTVIGETGAGQHGLALATACALLGLKCRIFMGETDVKKQYINVRKMKLLGAEVVCVERGSKTLKDAVDAAFEEYAKTYENSIYCIGSVVGPHPYPTIVRDFQSVVGREARTQFKRLKGGLPDAVVACVGGGSNAMGIFSGFLEYPSVALYGAEPLGRGEATGDNAASITFGKPAVMHGFKSLVLEDENGEPAEAYSVASGLDYPSVGPEHAYLKAIGRVSYVTVTDKEALAAFRKLSVTEGIIPALESSHAVAYALKLARALGKEKSIVVNLSGRGDKDVDFVLDNYPES